ncbi:MAG TPA: PstS family phosphate ABC transporter substrate-binding protein [Solirubrobacteraceae bacterium]|nr:PstS family phosphate ABC transporter substrate-binding protein [Solirubrobacteraceae bacterium]
MRYTKWLALPCCAALAFGVAACGGDDDSGSGGGSTTGAQNLSGTIRIDGSSTVFPFAQAAAETFQQQNPNVKITVGESGTGGGFEKFCNGETDISNASRAIEDDEQSACSEKRVTFAEIQVANDGIAVVSNPNLKIDCLTTDQLKQLWSTNRVKTYNQVDPKLPDAQVSLFGPGTDSGTFDFFTEEINGEEGRTRKDYQASEDDNVLVQGVAGDQNGLGYFGFSYYEQNQDKLNLIGVNAGGGCVKPSSADIQNGNYKPLSRPLLMYPSSAAVKRLEVKAFMDYMVANHKEIAEAAQIVPMTDAQAQNSKAAVAKLAGT